MASGLEAALTEFQTVPTCAAPGMGKVAGWFALDTERGAGAGVVDALAETGKPSRSAPGWLPHQPGADRYHSLLRTYRRRHLPE